MYDYFMRKAPANAAFNALMPVPVAWLLVYIIVWTVRWIRRGFQPST